MNITYALTHELRIKLKKPIGTLIQGSASETVKKVKDMIDKDKPVSIISVGDTVSENLLANQIFPKLLIVDNKVMRKRIQPILLAAEKTIRAKNPPGTITEEAIEAIQEAMKNNCHVKIVVEGEEDLLALTAIVYAPENAFVIYGQPNEGVVVVKVTQEKKIEVIRILKDMENVRKTK